MRTDPRCHGKAGQAGAEAAVALGLFTLLAAALFTLGWAAVRGLALQGDVRAEAGEAALVADADTSARRSRTEKVTVTGGRCVTVGDAVTMPGMVLSTEKEHER